MNIPLRIIPEGANGQWQVVLIFGKFALLTLLNLGLEHFNSGCVLVHFIIEMVITKWSTSPSLFWTCSHKADHRGLIWETYRKLRVLSRWAFTKILYNQAWNGGGSASYDHPSNHPSRTSPHVYATSFYEFFFFFISWTAAVATHRGGHTFLYIMLFSIVSLWI